MFDYARSSAQTAGLQEDALDLRVGVAEDLPVEDASFDTVICTLVIFPTPSNPPAFAVPYHAQETISAQTSANCAQNMGLQSLPIQCYCPILFSTASILCSSVSFHIAFLVKFSPFQCTPQRLTSCHSCRSSVQCQMWRQACGKCGERSGPAAVCCFWNTFSHHRKSPSSDFPSGCSTPCSNS